MPFTIDFIRFLATKEIHKDKRSSVAGNQEYIPSAYEVACDSAKTMRKLHDPFVFSRSHRLSLGFLSAAASMWLPVTQQRLFEFLCDSKCRNQWDILCNGASMETMLLIPNGQRQGRCVSLLQPAGKNQNESSMLILQETWNDASGALVVYAPVDVPYMNIVMSGGDSANVALLPSGFSILPDQDSQGCLLIVGFQILVKTVPTAKLNMESVETVNNLIVCTIHKIKAALRLPA